MNEAPGKNIIEEVALLKSISPSFVEKDWYVTQAIKIISEISFLDFQIDFTGGTALSKAHKLLQRFSEDIDFRITAPGLIRESKSQQRKVLSDFKKIITQSLLPFFAIDSAGIFARNGNQFFSFHLDYPSYLPPLQALRPHILIEFTLADLELPVMRLPVSSLIHDVAKRAPEVTIIECTDPVENACDKLSALTWRIPGRIRGQENDDPSMVRHLHDLAILSELALRNPGFKTIVTKTIEKDDKRCSKIEGLAIKEKLSIMMGILGEEEYQKEYERFVKGMSYAPDDEILSFHQAIDKLKGLINIFS